MRYFAFVLATLLIAAAMPSTAFADWAYTFQVPVTVSNLPAGSALQVECHLWAGLNRSGATLAAQTSGAAQVIVNTGSYSGTITVKASSPTAPASYGCWLEIYVGSTMANIVNGTPTNPSPGWTGTMLVTGNLVSNLGGGVLRP
jgi:hypothetical protein